LDSWSETVSQAHSTTGGSMGNDCHLSVELNTSQICSSQKDPAVAHHDSGLPE
jgi:hypothetical protein